jgi:hypothetical protein
VALLWSAWDWYLIGPVYAGIFLLLTGNYLIVWALGWVARSLLDGPWRVRPWQTFILVLNFVTLPIVFYVKHGQVVWGFLAINVLLFVGLYVSTAILLYFDRHLPLGNMFAASPPGTAPETTLDSPRRDSQAKPTGCNP